MHRPTIVALSLAILSLSSAVSADSEVPAAVDEYLMFAEYGGNTIRSEQIPASDWENVHVVDTRDAGQYEAEHIPGAVNIEWRRILENSDDLPRDRMVLVYCNTGTLSAQAGMALQIAGFNNVRILQGGFEGWKDAGGFEANDRAREAAGE